MQPEIKSIFNVDPECSALNPFGASFKFSFK